MWVSRPRDRPIYNFFGVELFRGDELTCGRHDTVSFCRAFVGGSAASFLV